MPLGGSKDKHFSCFHSSCQLGFKMLYQRYTLQIGLVHSLIVWRRGSIHITCQRTSHSWHIMSSVDWWNFLVYFRGIKLGKYSTSKKDIRSIRMLKLTSSTIAKKKQQFIKIVFCYQNCPDLLWEKNVLVIEKNFWNSRLKAKNLQTFWDH